MGKGVEWMVYLLLWCSLPAVDDQNPRSAWALFLLSAPLVLLCRPGSVCGILKMYEKAPELCCPVTTEYLKCDWCNRGSEFLISFYCDSFKFVFRQPPGTNDYHTGP